MNLRYIIFLLIALGIMAVNLSPNMISISIIVLLMAFVNEKGASLNFKYLLKYNCVVNASMFFLIIFLNIFFNFNEKTFIIWRISKLIVRDSLGFYQPNITSMLWLNIVICFLGFSEDLRKEKLWLCLLVVITALIYIKTLSRTSSIIILLLLAIVFFGGRRLLNRVPKFFRVLFSLTPILLSLLTIELCLTNSLFENFNEILTGRLAYYREYYYTNGGFHLLHSDLLQNATIDNSYIEALLEKGILFFLVLMIIYVYFGNYTNKITWKTCILYMSICFLAFTETSLQHFNLIFSLILLLGNNKFGIDNQNLKNRKDSIQNNNEFID